MSSILSNVLTVTTRVLQSLMWAWTTPVWHPADTRQPVHGNTCSGRSPEQVFARTIVEYQAA